jgi:hypothetical protein
MSTTRRAVGEAWTFTATEGLSYRTRAAIRIQKKNMRAFLICSRDLNPSSGGRALLITGGYCSSIVGELYKFDAMQVKVEVSSRIRRALCMNDSIVSCWTRMISRGRSRVTKMPRPL